MRFVCVLMVSLKVMTSIDLGNYVVMRNWWSFNKL
jgi:hypothetical protein